MSSVGVGVRMGMSRWAAFGALMGNCLWMLACSSDSPSSAPVGPTDTSTMPFTAPVAGAPGQPGPTPVAMPQPTPPQPANPGDPMPVPAPTPGPQPTAPSSSDAGVPVDSGMDSMTASDAAGPEPEPKDGIWLSPDGDDGQPGTKDMPLGTLTAALARAGAGETIWVMAGTFRPSATIAIRDGGQEGSPVQIFAAPGAGRPTFDFSAQPRGQSSARGFQISASYVHIRGLDVINAGDNCIHISGSHNIIEHVVTHGCSDTGLQITANSSEAGDPTRAAHNMIVNCDSYENYDAQNQGENADGFAAKLYIGPGNVFRGCRAWNNADDGWDLFASDDVVVIEDCWAVANGKIGANQNNTNGDGNGFKLGGAPRAGDANMGGAVHQVRNCTSVENATCGFVRNNNSQSPQLSMCGGRGDGRGTFCSLSNSGNVSVQLRAADVIGAQRDSDGELPPLR